MKRGREDVLTESQLQSLESDVLGHSDSDSENDIVEITPEGPAWVDEDEEGTTVDLLEGKRLRKLRNADDVTLVKGDEFQGRLRALFTQRNPTPKWATSVEEEADVAFEIEKSSSAISSSSQLSSENILMTRVADANLERYSNSVVTSVHFNGNGQMMLTAGLDKTLNIFNIDGVKNYKINSVFLDDLPIRTARFHNKSGSVFISGRRKYFYKYDLVNGKTQKIAGLIGRSEKSLEKFEVSPDGKLIAFHGSGGSILLVSTETLQMIGTLTMNGSLISLCFTLDSEKLLSIGSDGEVYVWDLESRRCISRFSDDGCVKGVCITAGAGVFATGSDSGVVNIYNMGATKPRKVIMNLTTAADFLSFNVDSQILAIASYRKKDALKLVHVPTGRVYANWPTMNTPLRYVNSLTFSPSSGYLAIGNDKGKVLLYRLNHYPTV